jgi:hypothetical protein
MRCAPAFVWRECKTPTSTTLLSLSLSSHMLGLGFDWHWSKTGRYPHQVTIMLELATSKFGTKQLCINCLELHSHYCCSFYSKVLEFHLVWISRPSNLQHFQSGSVEREEKAFLGIILWFCLIIHAKLHKFSLQMTLFVSIFKVICPIPWIPNLLRVLQNELCNEEILRIWHNCLVVFLGVTLSAVLGTLKNLYKT